MRNAAEASREVPVPGGMASIQFMVLDILEHMLAFAQNPGEMGRFLAGQIREFLGARIVALVHHGPQSGVEGMRVLAIRPGRYRNWKEMPELLAMAQAFREQGTSGLFSPEGAGRIPEGLRHLGMRAAVVVPLRVGSLPVGSLFALDLLEALQVQDVVRCLESLAPVVALVLQNATLFDSQEDRILASDRKLRNAVALNDQIIASAQEGIIVYDPQGRMQLWNPFMETLTGLRRDQVLGRGAADVFPFLEQAGVTGAMERVLQGEVIRIPAFVWAVPSTGRSGWATSCMAPLRTGRGEIIGIMDMVSDVTEWKRAEALQRKLETEIQQTQKMESIGSLAGGIAHDMNNVLGAIQAVTQTLSLQPGQGDALQGAVAIIERAATRGRTLVKGLTDFARRDLREAVPLDLNQLAREQAELLRHTTLKKVELELDLQDPLPPVLGECGSLASALLNLCVNALDAMPGGGRLSLRTRGEPGGKVELHVEDNGTGMPPAILERVMEPFFTTKETGKGTGLGLAVVYSVLKAHRGAVRIRSAVGEGTQVILEFPACEGAAPLPAAVEEVPGFSRSLEILLVDDDELIRASVPPMLECLGHRVRCAGGGREALGILAEAVRFDLMVLDLNMPGMNGAETLQALRSSHPALPVLLATGYLDEAAARVLQGDPRAFTIAKPFSLGELQVRLAELFPLPGGLLK